jgi:hypothetical protein
VSEIRRQSATSFGVINGSSVCSAFFWWLSGSSFFMSVKYTSEECEKDDYVERIREAKSRAVPPWLFRYFNTIGSTKTAWMFSGGWSEAESLLQAPRDVRIEGLESVPTIIQQLKMAAQERIRVMQQAKRLAAEL